MKKRALNMFQLTLAAAVASLILFANIPITQAVVDYKCPYTEPQECLAWTLNQTGGQAGFQTASNPNTFIDASSATISGKVGQIISYALTFLGVLFLVIAVMAGLQWMTAGGNEDKVKLAKTRLMNAAVGMIIITMAYAITWFVVNKLQKAVEYKQPSEEFVCNEANCSFFCETLNQFFINCDEYNTCRCSGELEPPEM
ncbi:TPA: hypothetical protein DCL28_04310 [Candidatus Komeilibacteria bacterium]|nr:MAG: hypothetical protein UW91_C0011G0021 [Parcubacteria group bacterium GW2011_GWF2_45_11]KKT96834.1 MAG: hypothetical protein UW98_C0033G0006 [Parcubacteria group bacterium GW2011_GWC2_45_15]OGY93553.1 MAG: hypothetical protein A3J95_02685 [Candidatus Komeilibacteria bacterium RIFOXYC2_FULL_45_12]HAH04746.1 hypothetical protein [Candidatus Komeilibacteria bacterium]HBV02524.1 hypothetical protein [Candidatus Komeilibacteria bacterium]